VRTAAVKIHVCLSNVPVSCNFANSSSRRVNHRLTEPEDLQESLHSPKDIKSITCSAHVTISSLNPATNIPFFIQKKQHETIRQHFENSVVNFLLKDGTFTSLLS
jgi:hypothetical protein